MTIGIASNFKVYQDEMRGGIVETLTQASNYFNGAGNAIILSTVSRRGDYAKESFFKNIANIVSRRNTTSVSAATDLSLLLSDITSVIQNSNFDPANQTYSAISKVAMDMTLGEFSFMLGEMIGKGMQVEMLNSALRAAGAALVQNSTVLYDAGTGTLTTADLVKGLAKFGDRASNITAWVMHSKNYFDLMEHQIGTSANGDIVSGTVVQAATPATLNRPVIVTDSDSLKVAGGSGSGAYTDYHVLGLTAGGVVVENSENERVVLDEVTGLENLVIRMQGEYAYNLGVKGYKYDVSVGANPSDANLGASATWDLAASSHKDVAGVIIQCR